MSFHPGAVIYLSLIELICMILYISFIPRRFTGVWYGVFSIASVGLLYGINEVFFTNLGYFTALLFYSFIFIWILIGYRVHFKAALFYLLVFFMADHCLKQIFSNINWSSFWRQFPILIDNPLLAMVYQVSVWTIYGILSAVVLIKIRGLIQNMDTRHLTWNRLALMFPAVAPVLYISYVILNLTNDQLVNVLAFEAVSSFCGLVLIISQERAHLANIYRLEIAELENSMHNQYERYLVSTEAANQINQACHDIKNQLIAFRSQESVLEKDGYFHELEKTISKYKTIYQTGNGVLDGLLFEKGKRAEQISTQLVCFADGTLLMDMRLLDLCTLIGNLLDNALDACEKVVNPVDRSVILKITDFRAYVLIRCENCFPGNVLRIGQEIVSTKTDARPHGFGLKGIRHVVEEYRGEMTIDSENGRFIVSILLPSELCCSHKKNDHSYNTP